VSSKEPSNGDRIASHAVVGIVTGPVIGNKAGCPGFIVGAVAGVVAHEALDAPVAGLIADLDIG
jgi:hypothetical protein